MTQLLFLFTLLLVNTISSAQQVYFCSSECSENTISSKDGYTCLDENLNGKEEIRDLIRSLAESMDWEDLFSNIQLVECAGHNNCTATYDYGGRRTIIYDPSYLKAGRTSFNAVNTTTLGSGKKNWRALAILGHELAHLAKGDLKSAYDIPPKERKAMEIEADFYSGKMLALLGATIEDIRLACTAYKEAACGHHPKKEDRVNSMIRGLDRIKNQKSKAPKNNRPSSVDNGKRDETKKYKEIDEKSNSRNKQSPPNSNSNSTSYSPKSTKVLRLSTSTKTIMKGKLRITPDASSYLLTTIPNGANIEIIGYHKSSGYWKAKYAGQEGFVNELYLKPNNSMSNFVLNSKGTRKSNAKATAYRNANSTPNPNSVKVLRLSTSTKTRMKGKLRVTPDASSYLLTTIPNGANIEIIGYHKSSGYWKAKYAGQEGFVNELYLKPNNSMSNFVLNSKGTRKSNANNTTSNNTKSNTYTSMSRSGKIRKSPSAMSDVLISLAVGTRIKVVEYHMNGYWKVEYKNHIGYVSELFVQKNSSMYK